MGRGSYLLTIVISLGLFIVVNARFSSSYCTPSPTPAPFRHFLVYSAQGIYDPLIGEFPFKGCSPVGFCAGGDVAFLKRIMKFTEREVSAEEGRAREFFLERFGLDVQKLSAEGRVSLFSWVLDPRQEYTAFVFSGESVPSEGYQVRDGGYILTITDPEGIGLGGELRGQKAPMGALILFGIYDILITGPNAREEIIRYKSITPMIPSQGFIINCELEHPVWGKGLAQGLVSSVDLGDGKIQASIRNVLTFPPHGNSCIGMIHGSNWKCRGK